MERLIAKGSQFGFRHRQGGREIRDNYTRVSGRERIIAEWDEDDEPEPDAIRAAVKKKLDEIYPKLADVPLAPNGRSG